MSYTGGVRCLSADRPMTGQDSFYRLLLMAFVQPAYISGVILRLRPVAKNELFKLFENELLEEEFLQAGDCPSVQSSITSKHCC